MAHVNPTYICRYQTTIQPTTKSDVYSFGVVLLELVTGRSAILRDPEPISIIQWTRQRLARGNIEGVVDPRMHGDHDVNSVWKVADIALKCTTMASTQRPTMADVVIQLQECLELEEFRIGHGDLSNSFYASGSNDPYTGYNQYNIDGQSNDISQNSAFEVEHNFGRVPTIPTGPSAR
jgi:serine/threonine protein kinase